ncbi:MAG: TRAP transporter small permease [Spirochaetes bacterium]|nr:TRAP transporter small permease [Spirochaetota bacterium]
MKNFDPLITNLEKKICQVFLIFIILFVFCAALLRWFGYPLVWSIDLSQLLFVWVCFLGADLALQQDKHIGVDILVRMFPQRVQKTLALPLIGAIILFLAIVGGYGAYLAIINYRRQFSGLELSYSWATASVPVGSLLMIRTLVKKFVKQIRR